MKCLGSGENGEFTFLDVIALISFCVGLENLEMNITQEDMQNATERLDRGLRENVSQIHQHLDMQDDKINYIITLLREGGAKK